MKPQVLIAVVDRGPWTKHRAALPHDWDVVFVESARSALERLARPGAVAVVIAELRLPDMSGLDLLAAARQHMPATGRVLVVESDDREAALEAINRAHVHAIFIHPFASDAFGVTVREALVENQTHLHQRAVLAGLSQGMVQLLTGLVHPEIVMPIISEAGQRLRERARLTAQALKLPTVADLESAALLSRVALASVPRHVLDKLRTHDRLTPDETALLARLPAIGLAMVESHPRFAGVAEIFRAQGTDPGSPTVNADGIREHKVPLASRILRALVDVQLFENAGLTIPAALAEMRRQSARYDGAVLKAIETLFAGPNPAASGAIEECMVADLVVGCVLATDALSHEGVPLVSAGATVTQTVLHHLQNFAELGEIIEPLYVLRESLQPAEVPPADAAASNADAEPA